MMVFGKMEPVWSCLDLEFDKNLSNFTNEEKLYTCEQLSNLSCKNLSMSYDFRSVVIDVRLVRNVLY